MDLPAGEGKPGLRSRWSARTIAEARSDHGRRRQRTAGGRKRHGRRLNWEPSLGRLTWPNGSQAQLFSGDNADGLRGPEHDFAWCDELAKWTQAQETWDNLQFGLRRGPRPRALVTTTPRPGPLLTQIEASARTVTTRGRTSDNINLDEKVIELLTATYGGTRIGRQELDGELLEDVEGALWTREMIEAARVRPSSTRAPRDGPQSLSRRGDEGRISTGSWSGSIRRRGRRDGRMRAGSWSPDRAAGGSTCSRMRACRGCRPEGWASRVAAAAARWGAGLVVAEANNGGAMVESVLKAAEVPVKVRLVHASRGKCARAEPIALKFETGKAFFAGRFPELEAELARDGRGRRLRGPGRSPDRADAMVWAMTVLSETRSGVPRVRRL